MPFAANIKVYLRIRPTAKPAPSFNTYDDEDVVEVISNYVFGSDEQNRLFYEDYENIIRSSPFEVMCMKGYDHPELGEKYNHQVTPEILRALRARFPEYRNFGYDGILLLMSKPTSGGVDAHASGP